MVSNIATIVAECKKIRESGEPGNRGHIWMRPISWRGLGQAIDLQGTRMDIVPFLSRSARYQPHPRELMEEWELVDPKDVLAERAK